VARLTGCSSALELGGAVQALDCLHGDPIANFVVCAAVEEEDRHAAAVGRHQDIRLEPLAAAVVAKGDAPAAGGVQAHSECVGAVG
jgi:hypothetical protein